MRGRVPLAVVAAIAGIALIGAGAASALRRSSAPSLRGDAVWGAGSRPAPEIALHDAQGRRFALAHERGRVVMLTVLDSRCRTLCPIEGRILARAARSLPVGMRPDLVVVSVNPRGDTSAGIRHAERGLLDGPRRVTWLVGSYPELKRVWHEWGVEVRGAEHTTVAYLIDAHGDTRVGILAPILVGEVERDLRGLQA
jgi:cytochrome oxidase Cu insertion factor (SCO1/SenC/PrrC family)